MFDVGNGFTLVATNGKLHGSIYTIILNATPGEIGMVIAGALSLILKMNVAKLDFEEKLSNVFKDSRSYIHLEDAKIFFLTRYRKYDITV